MQKNKPMNNQYNPKKPVMKNDYKSQPSSHQNPNTDDLMYEIEILLEGMLYYAGVKKEKLQKACDLFIENIDDVLADCDYEGVDEMIKMIDFLKNNHPDLFNN